MKNTTSFVGGKHGPWLVTDVRKVMGQTLEMTERVDMVRDAIVDLLDTNAWVLKAFTSNVRYAVREEVDILRTVQPGLDRPEALCGVLIPIKKSIAWWEMAQDERRAIFEEVSHHTAIGLEYLPGVARRLFHCRDLGEPFDFLTWFEFAPEHTHAFNDLLNRLRATREWEFVEREVEIRLQRSNAC